jgi:transketolase
MRQEFVECVSKFGLKDERVQIIVGDISHFAFKDFYSSKPHQFLNIGILEQTMLSVAAGFAISNRIPIVHTITPFLIERAFEQIKLDFGYQRLGINLFGVGGTFDYSQLGCSHHSYSDVAMIKSLEESNVFIPGSLNELEAIFDNVYAKKQINYFRLPASPHNIQIPANKDDIFEPKFLSHGVDLTLICTAPNLPLIVEIEKELRLLNINIDLIYLNVIKPLKMDKIFSSIAKTKKLLVVEELSKTGGIFEDILSSENSSRNSFSSFRIGPNDTFLRGYGSVEDHRESIGINKENIIYQINRLLKG